MALLLTVFHTRLMQTHAQEPNQLQEVIQTQTTEKLKSEKVKAAGKH